MIFLSFNKLICAFGVTFTCSLHPNFHDSVGFEDILTFPDIDVMPTIQFDSYPDNMSVQEAIHYIEDHVKYTAHKMGIQDTNIGDLNLNASFGGGTIKGVKLAFQKSIEQALGLGSDVYSQALDRVGRPTERENPKSMFKFFKTLLTDSAHAQLAHDLAPMIMYGIPPLPELMLSKVASFMEQSGMDQIAVMFLRDLAIKFETNTPPSLKSLIQMVNHTTSTFRNDDRFVLTKISKTQHKSFQYEHNYLTTYFHLPCAAESRACFVFALKHHVQKEGKVSRELAGKYFSAFQIGLDMFGLRVWMTFDAQLKRMRVETEFHYKPAPQLLSSTPQTFIKSELNLRKTGGSRAKIFGACSSNKPCFYVLPYSFIRIHGDNSAVDNSAVEIGMQTVIGERSGKDDFLLHLKPLQIPSPSYYNGMSSLYVGKTEFRRTLA